MNSEGEVFWADQDHRLFVNRRLGAWEKEKRKEGEQKMGMSMMDGIL